MSDDSDKDNVRFLFRDIPDEFESDLNYDWENMIDLAIYDLRIELDNQRDLNRQLWMGLEDVHRDINELKRALSLIIEQLYTERK